MNIDFRSNKNMNIDFIYFVNMLILVIGFHLIHLTYLLLFISSYRL